MARSRLDVDELSTTEKLELIDELWVNLSQTPAAISLTAAQAAEIDARLDDMDAGRTDLIPWRQVLRRMTDSGG